MVRVPNVASLSNVNARAAITNSGLVVSPLSATINTNISSQGGIILAQSPASQTLVDYETPVVINLGNFIADTVTTGPCIAYSTTTASNYCSGTLLVYGSTTTKRKAVVTTRNNVTGVSTSVDNFAICTDIVKDNGSAYVDGQCNYTTPPTTCTATRSEGAWSSCSAAQLIGSRGTQTRTVSGTNTNCTTYSNTETQFCYQVMCGTWGAWGSHPTDIFKQRRFRTCQYANGTTYSESQDQCRKSQTDTYSTCVNKKRTQTTKYYSCGKLVDTKYTYNLPCNAL